MNNSQEQFRAVQVFRDWYPQVWVSYVTSSGQLSGWKTITQLGKFTTPERAIQSAQLNW